MRAYVTSGYHKDVVNDLGAKVLVWAGLATIDDDEVLRVSAKVEDLERFRSALEHSSVPVALAAITESS